MRLVERDPPVAQADAEGGVVLEHDRVGEVDRARGHPGALSPPRSRLNRPPVGHHFETRRERRTDMDVLRIAMLAPPWIPVPAPAYGGIEEVVRLLAAGLVERGHDVTLFAAPDSRSPAEVHPVLDDSHPDEIERSVW